MGDDVTGNSLRGRLDYQPIHQRPALKLPGGARCGLDHRQRRELATNPGNAAHRAAAADGPAVAAGRSELGLA